MRKHLWTIAFFFALIAGILLAGVLSAISYFVTEPHTTALWVSP